MKNTIIRNIRISRGLSVNELAKRAGISSKFVYDIENGKKGFSADVLLRLAESLNVSCDYLLTGKDSCVDEELLHIIKTLSAKEQAAAKNIILEMIKLR